MKRQWSEAELEVHWTLSAKELALLAGRTGYGRFGFAVLLKYFQYEGRFPDSRREAPAEVVRYLAEQLRTPLKALDHYDWQGRTAKRQRTEILSWHGIRRLEASDWESLALWLHTELLPGDHSLEQLTERTKDWLRSQGLESPGVSRLEKLLGAETHAYELRLLSGIGDELTDGSRAGLDRLLEAPEDENANQTPEKSDRLQTEPEISFSHLRHDAGRVSLDSLLQELAKLKAICELGLPSATLGRLPPKWLQKFRLRAGVESIWDLRRHPTHVRYGLTATFCFQRQHEIVDGLIDLLMQIIHKIDSKAEKKVEQQLLEDFRRVRGKSSLLFRLAEAAVDHPEDLVKEALYPVVGLQTLQALVKEFKTSGPAFRRVVHTVLRASYSNHYRRMLPHLLDALEFRSNNEAHRPVIEALSLLRQHRESRQQYFSINEVPVKGVIRDKWREIVIEEGKDGKERINRINYEICVLQSLRERLQCKEIWVLGAQRYRNPDDDLPADFGDRRAAYYDALGQPVEVELFMNGIQKAMSDALATLNQGLPKNPRVTLRPSGKNRIVLTPLDAQPDPPNLQRLKAEIFKRWFSTDLLDVFKEADLRVGFSDAFQSAGRREVLDRASLQRRLLLCLYALGTNTGLKRVVSDEQAVTYKELRYVRERFIRKDTLRNAIARVVNATFAVRQSAIWGHGSTTCASDSKKFGAWDQNLMTEWHIRYGGRGVMIYWHVERKSLCIYSQLKRCSSSEVAAMIEGVLRHESDMEIHNQYTDSHGQSEVGFAFCYLLGFELLPRLKAIASQKLYLPSAGSAGDYANLEPVLTRPINWTLIRQQYDEMVKYATALRLGTAEAEAILRRFQRGNRQHPTYQALAELGKAIKTIFLCRYLQSEGLRREIHEGLNVVENWNSANSFIFFGKGGEVATNQLEDQEVSVLALHLLQICMVYVNTLLIQRVLSEPRWWRMMQAADLRALSPLIYAHINPYGRFDLDMDKRLPIEALALAA
jgi:TnpA family transposase